MSPFDLEIQNSLPEMFKAFGSEILVKGIKVPGIFNLDDFEDETGYRKMATIEIDRENLDYFRRGDSCYVDGVLFEIKNIPENDEVLATVELIYA